MVGYVLRYGTDSGTPPDYVTVGAFPDGTTANPDTGIPDQAPLVTVDVRVDPTLTADVLLAQIKAALIAVAAQAVTSAAARSLLTPYLGQPVPLS